ncbi:Ig-like domain-containing protein [Variovorax boronicumulans]
MASEKTTIAVGETNIDRAASAGMSTFTVQQPVLDGAFDNAGDIQGNLAPGSITDDRQPEFHGQGTPGDTIVIQDNGTEIGKARVGASGLWSFTPSTDMGEGLHAITLIARDASGNESAPSAPFNFEIDVTPPDASQLAITGVLDTVGGITGNITSGAATDDARPLISGTSSGVPGHTVIVRVRDASGERELGRAVIGEHGNWTLQVDAPLASGQNMLRVYEVDVAGNETALTAPYRVTVNTEKPAAPVIESVFDDVGTPHMLLPGEVTDDARPTLSGTAPAKHTVQLYDGATYLGETVADARGNWSFTPTVALPEGPHNITATATDKIGNVSEPSGPFPLTTDYTAPAASDAVLSDDVGPVQGPIAHGSVTDDSTPTYAGNAEPNTTVVIYDHGKEIGRTQTNGAGDWTFTPTVPLTIGQHIRINSGDFERLDGGLGIDTLVMDGKSMHIDLSALGMKVQGFEKFDLGAGGNTLALSASDVLAGGVRDMVTADGKVQMLVNGANGDVDLLGGSDGWTQGGNTTVGDVTYSVYTNLAGTAELLVEDKVHVTIM